MPAGLYQGQTDGGRSVGNEASGGRISACIFPRVFGTPKSGIDNVEVGKTQQHTHAGATLAVRRIRS